MVSEGGAVDGVVGELVVVVEVVVELVVVVVVVGVVGFCTYFGVDFAVGFDVDFGFGLTVSKSVLLFGRLLGGLRVVVLVVFGVVGLVFLTMFAAVAVMAEGLNKSPIVPVTWPLKA